MRGAHTSLHSPKSEASEAFYSTARVSIGAILVQEFIVRGESARSADRPERILLHGITSSIAEYYSRDLAASTSTMCLGSRFSQLVSMMRNEQKPFDSMTAE